MKHAYFLVLPDCHALDLAGPLHVIATLRELGLGDVSVECIGPRRELQTFQKLSLAEVRPLPAELRPDAALFVIGCKLGPALMRSRPWLEAVAWLQRLQHASRRPLRICGVCTGSFLLAEAGLLDGRLCTTHHRFVQQLRQSHPRAHVTENRVYVQDGPVWTSAGVTSGIDLALQLIAELIGEDAALQVARENVVHFRRFGGDPQLIASRRYRAHSNARIHTVQDAIASKLADRVTVAGLARSVGCGERQLARAFVAETGITIKRFQTELRMERVRRLVSESTLSLERIAERCGFGSVQALRAHWNKIESQPPSALRAKTSGAARLADPDA